MNASAIDLAQFCASEADSRHYLHRPHPLLDGAAASNGYILVFAAGVVVPVADEGAQPLPPKTASLFEEYIRAVKAFDFANPTDVGALSLEGYEKCRLCAGHGRLHRRECVDCDGEGTFEHGRHCYECKECRGDGGTVFGTNDASDVTCSECLGSRLRPDTVLFGGVEGSGINTIYARLLQRLPSCVIAWDERNLIPFRFDGGCGLLQPMRGGPRQRVQGPQ